MIKRLFTFTIIVIIALIAIQMVKAKDDPDQLRVSTEEGLFINGKRITSERSYEVCEDGKCTAYFYPKDATKWVENEGSFTNFTNIATMEFNNDSGKLTYSFKEDYSLSAQLFLVLNSTKDECVAHDWDWSDKDNMCFVMWDQAKKFMSEQEINYDVIVEKRPDRYKYTISITDIPEDFQSKFLYVGLRFSDPQRKLNLKHNNKLASLDVKNIMRLTFDDLLKEGFTVDFYDDRTVLIGNINNKEDLLLDPLFSPTSETSDGYIYGYSATSYSSARGTSDYSTTTSSSAYVGQDPTQYCSGTAAACSTFESEPDCDDQTPCSWDGYGCSGTATACSSIYSSSTCGMQYNCTWYTKYWVYRAYLDFDTSSISDNAVVSNVVLSLKNYVDYSTTNFDVEIYKFTWSEALGSSREANYDASGAALDADWRNTSGMSNGVYYDSSPLDTTWINLTGDTKYMLKSQEDRNNSTPLNNEYIRLYSADSSGNEPILKVTYDIPTNAVFFGTNF